MIKDSLIRNDAELTIIGPSQRKGYFIFAQPLAGDLAESVYRAVKNKINLEYHAADSLSDNFRHWSFDDSKKMIKGSNPFLGVLADTELAKNGLYLPGLNEGRMLALMGKLSPEFYRDFGIVCYNEGNPNGCISRRIAEDAAHNHIAIPVLLPFGALKLGISDGDSNKLLFHMAEQPSGFIENPDLQKHSGTFRVIYENEIKLINNLNNSSEYGLMDFACGEASVVRLGSLLKWTGRKT